MRFLIPTHGCRARTRTTRRGQRAARQFQRHFEGARNEERLECLEGKLAALQLISSELAAWRARQKQKKRSSSEAHGQQGAATTAGDKLAAKKKKNKKLKSAAANAVCWVAVLARNE